MQWRGNNKTAPPQNDMVLAVNSACTGSAACPGWQIHIYHCNMVCFLSQRSIKILEEGKQSCRGASTQLNKKRQGEHYQSHKKITFRRLCWSLYVSDQMMKINTKSGRSPTDVLFSSQMRAGLKWVPVTSVKGFGDAMATYNIRGSGSVMVWALCRMRRELHRLLHGSHQYPDWYTGTGMKPSNS